MKSRVGNSFSVPRLLGCMELPLQLLGVARILWANALCPVAHGKQAGERRKPHKAVAHLPQLQKVFPRVSVMAIPSPPPPRRAVCTPPPAPSQAARSAFPYPLPLPARLARRTPTPPP